MGFPWGVHCGKRCREHGEDGCDEASSWRRCGLLVAALSGTSVARDRPFSTAELIAMKWGPLPKERDLGTGGGTTDPGGQFSVEQIERFRCTSAGNPAAAVDISCNTTEYNQDWNPDNEIAVAVDPINPNHILAGSNDYVYRFNNSTGARQVLIPTGFFTSFDGGATWIDGQIPIGRPTGCNGPLVWSACRGAWRAAGLMSRCPVLFALCRAGVGGKG
jgi:hypothetical protein